MQALPPAVIANTDITITLVPGTKAPRLEELRGSGITLRNRSRRTITLHRSAKRNPNSPHLAFQFRVKPHRPTHHRLRLRVENSTSPRILAMANTLAPRTHRASNHHPESWHRRSLAAPPRFPLPRSRLSAHNKTAQLLCRKRSGHAFSRWHAFRHHRRRLPLDRQILHLRASRSRRSARNHSGRVCLHCRDAPARLVRGHRVQWAHAHRARALRKRLFKPCSGLDPDPGPFRTRLQPGESFRNADRLPGRFPGGQTEQGISSAMGARRARESPHLEGSAVSAHGQQQLGQRHAGG